jgi:hypothetical protein
MHLGLRGGRYGDDFLVLCRIPTEVWKKFGMRLRSIRRLPSHSERYETTRKDSPNGHRGHGEVTWWSISRTTYQETQSSMELHIWIRRYTSNTQCLRHRRNWKHLTDHIYQKMLSVHEV